MPGAGEISLTEIGQGFVEALRAWADFVNGAPTGNHLDAAVILKAGVARLYLAKLGLKVPRRPITVNEANQLETMISFREMIRGKFEGLNLDRNSTASVVPYNNFLQTEQPNIDLILDGNLDGINYLRNQLRFDEGTAGGVQYGRWPTVTPFTASDLAGVSMPSTEFTAPSLDGIASSLEREQAASTIATGTYSSTSLLSVDLGPGLAPLIVLRPDVDQDEPIYGSLARFQILPTVTPQYEDATSPFNAGDDGFDPAVVRDDQAIPPPDWQDIPDPNETTGQDAAQDAGGL